MPNTIRSILCVDDLGDGSEAVLAYAIDLANRLGARLQIVAAIADQREKSLIEIDTHVPQEMLDKYHADRAQRVRHHMEAQITAFYAVRADDTPARPITDIIVHEGDDIPKLILDEAKASAADMIVMASRGEGVLAALLFGSVVHDVSRRTAIPLLLVPVQREAKAGERP